MSVIASSAIENDEDLIITAANRRAMVKMVNNESDKESSADEFEKDESSSAEESESEEEDAEDSESIDSEAERINEMAD